ncbi:MAG: YciI family protein [Microcoleaceae cyanobacterium]
MPWFVKIEQGIVEKSVFDQYVPDHIAYVKGLANRGYKARSGYWERRGGGMLIFEAESMEVAKAIVEADPLVKNHCVSYELYHWCIVAE